MPVCLDQRQLPGVSRLFADYLYDFARVAAFFGQDGAALAPISLAAAAARVDYPAERRARVAAALEAQNRGWGAGPATLAHLDQLRRPGTVAVVSGQQTGLLGGPLLTVYKAATAVLAAEHLRSQGQAAVPVFWLATQDHDLAEVNQAWVVSADGQPARLELPAPDAPPRSPVGRVLLGDGIAGVLSAFAQATSAAPEAMAALAASYQPGASFASAFARLLTMWFAPWGLILMDPMDQTLAAEAAPLLAEVVAREDALAASLRQRGKELESAGYHLQVNDAGAALLFLETEGQRQPLRRATGGWHAGDRGFATAELADVLAAEPLRVSPGALLRPLVQDWLLPTAAQVTGPAETAYLAQSAALYAALGRTQPLRLPRLSATLVDARARRLLEKYHLSVPDIWRLEPQGDAAEALALHLARQVLPEDLTAELHAQRDAASRGFAAFSDRLGAVDPTLVDFVRTAGDKVRHQFEQVEDKLARSLARRQADLARQARHLAGLVYPGRHLQERRWNSAAAAVRLGTAWPGLLHDQLRFGCRDHQILDI